MPVSDASERCHATSLDARILFDITRFGRMVMYCSYIVNIKPSKQIPKRFVGRFADQKQSQSESRQQPTSCSHRTTDRLLVILFSCHLIT
jgi:hypothetical protein